MNKIPEIKIIRLNTGEDIISSCIFDDETNSVLLDNPMKIGMSRGMQAKTAVMVLMPWLPIELIDEDSTYINQNDIIAVMNPKASMIEYYTNLLDEFEKAMLEDEQSLTHEFNEEKNDNKEENDELSALHDIIFGTTVEKKTTYH